VIERLSDDRVSTNEVTFPPLLVTTPTRARVVNDYRGNSKAGEIAFKITGCFTLFPRSEERVIKQLSDDRVSPNEATFPPLLVLSPTNCNSGTCW